MHRSKRTLLLIALCLSMSTQEALTGKAVSDSMEDGDEIFFDELQANYIQGIVDMITTFQNFTSTLAEIATKMEIMDQKITASTKGMGQMESKIEASTKILEQMDSKITALSMELKDFNSLLIQNSTTHDNKTVSGELKNIEKSSNSDQNLVKVELYEGRYLTGNTVKINSEETRYCFNLVAIGQNKDRYNFNDKINSLTFQGNCIRLYEHWECQGKTLELFRGVRVDCQQDLRNCGFNNTVTSISACY